MLVPSYIEHDPMEITASLLRCPMNRDRYPLYIYIYTWVRERNQGDINGV